MADSMVPRTPSPAIHPSKSTYTSLTPPPTTQAQRYTEPRPQSTRNAIKPGAIPTLEEARSLSGEQCRNLVLELIPMLGEVRMQLAHTTLQLQLLSISSSEAAQKAEVEHEMTKREVDVLRANSPVLRGRPAAAGSHSLYHQVQRQLEITLQTGQALEEENQQIKGRLKQAKRLIKYLNGQKLQLSDDKDLLRERIKQNRAHAEAYRATLPTPELVTPRARAPTQPLPRSDTPASVQNIDALLMADQILNQDPSSMPGTPRPMHPRNGHTRGVHSLSSLPTTPARSRRMSTSGLRISELETPTNRIIAFSPHAAAYTEPVRHSAINKPFTSLRGDILTPNELGKRSRADREETISASEDEAVSDDQVVSASQASQVASGMLKKSNQLSGAGSIGGNEGGYSWMKPAGSTAAGSAENGAREGEKPRKKARNGDGSGEIGLGIKPWNSPARR